MKTHYFVLGSALVLSACGANVYGLKTPDQARAAFAAIEAECAAVPGLGPYEARNSDIPMAYQQNCRDRYLQAKSDIRVADAFQRKGISMFGGRDYSYGPGGRYPGVIPRGGWY